MAAEATNYEQLIKSKISTTLLRYVVTVVCIIRVSRLCIHTEMVLSIGWI